MNKMTLITANGFKSYHLHTPTTDIDHASDIASAVSWFNRLSFPLRHRAIGVAANQVGVMDSIFVAKIKNVWKFFINPKVVGRSEAMVNSVESCLSVHNTTVSVKRYEWVEIEWLDRKGEVQKGRFYHHIYPMIQHEIDHLHGILITDKVEDK